MQTENIGSDTWRFVEGQIDQMSDWSLGQTIQELETAMEAACSTARKESRTTKKKSHKRRP